jgi:hypothetical protein
MRFSESIAAMLIRGRRRLIARTKRGLFTA